VAIFGLASEIALAFGQWIATARQKAFTTEFTENAEKFAKEKRAGRMMGGRIMVGGGYLGNTNLGREHESALTGTDGLVVM
jgi:hypothetical protein